MDTMIYPNSGKNNSIYFEHITKQLIKKVFSNAGFDIYLSKIFHPEKKFNFKDVVDRDDVYFQSISILAEKNLDYYLKYFEIIVKVSDYKVVDYQYDYYGKSECISNTDIQVKFI